MFVKHQRRNILKNRSSTWQSHLLTTDTYSISVNACSIPVSPALLKNKSGTSYEQTTPMSKFEKFNIFEIDRVTTNVSLSIGIYCLPLKE